MKVEIVRIADRGIPNKERLHLSVMQDLDLGGYVVVLNRYEGPNEIASGDLTSFWFPTQPVKAGDQIVLYSGLGKPSIVKLANGSTVYFYHWGKSQTIWQDASSCAVLVEPAEWQTSPPNS